MLFANIAGASGCPFPLFVIFWTRFHFPKSYVFHVLARHFLLVMSIWCAQCDGIWRFYWTSGSVYPVRTPRRRPHRWFVGVRREVSCVGFVCSTVKAEPQIPQFTKKPGSRSVLPPALSVKCISILIMFFWLLSTRWIYLFNMRDPKIFFHICV